MAHNIEIRNNIASFVASEPAWHNLGKVYNEPITSADALIGCNANFNVSKQPIVSLTPQLITQIENGEMINPEDLKELIHKDMVATMRTDYNEVLGIVSKNYGVVQNQDAFKFIDALCTGGNNTPCIDSAGVLGHGERIFITAKFPEPIRLAHKDNDLVNMYIVFTTSHDGTGAVSAMVTPIRVVCQNTLNAAFGCNKGRWNVRHTSNVSNNMMQIQEATRALGLYEVYKTEFEDKMSQLANIQLTDDDVKRIAFKTIASEESFKLFFETKNPYHEDIPTRTKNKFDALMESIYGGVGQDMLDTNSGLHLYNGMTYYLDNVAPNVGKGSTPETIFVSTIEGNTYKKQQICYDEILKVG